MFAASEGAVRRAEGLADRAVVRVEPQRREQRAVRRADRGLRGLDAALRREEVRASVERPREHLVERRRRHRRVGNLVGQREHLAERQADRARELQLRLLEFVLRGEDTLALGLLLHLRAQHVDAGDDAGRLQVLRLREERVGRRLLRARHLHAAAGRDRLEIQVHRDEDHEVARRPDAVLLGLEVQRRGARIVQRRHVDHRLGQIHAGVVHVEGADDRRLGGEAVRFEVDDLPPAAERARHVGQQLRQRAPSRAPRRGLGFLLQQQAEVVLQRPLDRVLHRQRQRLGGHGSFRHAAEEGIRRGLSGALRGRRMTDEEEEGENR